MNGTVKGLEFNTTYYVVATAIDYSKQESIPSESLTVTTGGNNAPIITPNEEIVMTISQAASESRNVELHIYDNDGHSLSYSIDPQISGVSLALNPGEDAISYLTFNAAAMNTGANTGSLVITDEYGMSSSVAFNVTVEGNEAPTLIKEFENIRFTSQKQLQLQSL